MLWLEHQQKTHLEVINSEYLFQDFLLHTHKLKGKAKGGELTCEKGMFPSKQVEEVFRNSLASDDDRCTIVVALLDAKGNVARDWKLAECWCSAWEAGDLDASSEDVLVETITIQYEYFLD